MRLFYNQHYPFTYGNTSTATGFDNSIEINTGSVNRVCSNQFSGYAVALGHHHQLRGNNTITTNSGMISSNTRPSVQSDFNPNATFPTISNTAFIDPLAVVIGDYQMGKLVLVAPFAVCRGDEGTPIHVETIRIYKMVLSLKQYVMAKSLMTEDIQLKGWKSILGPEYIQV